MKRPISTIVLALSAAASCAVQAEAPDWGMGRYLSKYPGMYSTLSYYADERNSIFDQNGQKQNSVTPTFGAGNAFAEKRVQLQLEWHFPFFETEELPLISSRLWTARANLGYARLETTGSINDFIRQNDQKDRGQGVSDILLEFGPVLWGSHNWREKQNTPFSLILLSQFVVPVGERHPDSPNNVGTNVFGFGGRLGAYLRPFNGLLLDAGIATRSYANNEEPAFGGHEPTKRGDDVFIDGTLSLKLWRGLYAGASYWQRKGDPNIYQKVRFANNPPSAATGMDTFPDPRALGDGGTEDTRLGYRLSWFVTPRLNIGLSRVQPRSGKSGEFDLPYLQQTRNCTATMNCNPQPNGSAHVDGLGSARVFASEYWLLTLNWSWKQGDFFLNGP